jgi:hypothetical protein
VGGVMSEATRLIADGFVRLKDRKALEELREHRQKLLNQMRDQPKGWVDTSKTMQIFADDLNVISAALDRL